MAVQTVWLGGLPRNDQAEALSREPTTLGVAPSKTIVCCGGLGREPSPARGAANVDVNGSRSASNGVLAALWHRRGTDDRRGMARHLTRFGRCPYRSTTPYAMDNRLWHDGCPAVAGGSELLTFLGRELAEVILDAYCEEARTDRVGVTASPAPVPRSSCLSTTACCHRGPRRSARTAISIEPARVAVGEDGRDAAHERPEEQDGQHDEDEDRADAAAEQEQAPRRSGCLAERTADAPKIRPLHGEPPQNRHNRAAGGHERTRSRR